MSMYYDRSGRPMTTLEWAEAMESLDYRIVAQDTLPDGTLISTVWLGLNHNYGHGKPLIFETMVFAEDRKELDVDRYSTEEEAKEGHLQAVKKWSK